MVSEVITGLQIFTQLFNTAKSLSEIHDATIRDQAVFTLQRQILEAQAQQSALVQRVSELEKELTRFETWDAEKERYELASVGRGAFAYRLKEAMKAGQPDHCICAACYEKRTKSVLQEETWFPGRAHVLSCHNCGAAVYISGSPSPEHASYRQKGR